MLEEILVKAEQRGLQLLGIKSLYFSKKTIGEFQAIDKFKFPEEMQGAGRPITCLVFYGADAVKKMKKLLGSEDPDLARKVEAKTINAMYASKLDKSAIAVSGKVSNRRLMSYIFGGRLTVIDEAMYEALLIDQDAVQERVNYVDKPLQHCPIFQLSMLRSERFLIIPRIILSLCVCD